MSKDSMTPPDLDEAFEIVRTWDDRDDRQPALMEDAASLVTALALLEPVWRCALDYADSRNGPRWRETAIALDNAIATARRGCG
jgi:hypothetical protein